MTKTKIVAELADRSAAQQLASSLEQLFEPTPTALTLFASADGWRIEAYFEDAPDHADLAATAALVAPSADTLFRTEPVPEENWVAKSQAALPPVKAGRFTIHGSHDAKRIPRGPWSILIDAGEAFGTAHHPTTTSCLRAIDRSCRQTKLHHALDLGTGSGILAIALARLSPSIKIDATDIDTDAARIARENAWRNRTGNQIRTATRQGPPHIAVMHAKSQHHQQYDFIVANILAGPLHDMAPAISRALRPAGTLVLSGILAAQAAAIRARYIALGLILHAIDHNGEWTTLTMKKRPPNC